MLPHAFPWERALEEQSLGAPYACGRSCIPIDVYPNRSVQYLHEHSLLERGNAPFWMDDPSEP